MSGRQSYAPSLQRQQFTPSLGIFSEQSGSSLPPTPASKQGTFSNFTSPAMGTRELSEAGSSYSPPLSPPASQPWDLQSAVGSSNSQGTANAHLLIGALQTEMKDQRKKEVIDGYLSRVQQIAATSDKDTERLVTAGAIPQLIQIVKIRAASGDGLDSALITLGLLA